jgi:hypothetical protein
LVKCFFDLHGAGKGFQAQLSEDVSTHHGGFGLFNKLVALFYAKITNIYAVGRGNEKIDLLFKATAKGTASQMFSRVSFAVGGIRHSVFLSVREG